MTTTQQINRAVELSKAVARTFDGEDGRKTLLWLLQQGGVFATTPTTTDPIAIAQAAARRDFAIEIAHMANFGPADFLELQTAARNEYGRDERSAGRGGFYDDNDF